VTLLAGIICKDGIVVASDSQTTWDSGKSWNANKMTELEHPYGRALVAESGAEITSAAMVEELVKLAGDKQQFDEHKLSGLAELAVRKVRQRLRAQNFECSSEELQDIIWKQELDSKIMIAHYDGNRPVIDTIGLTAVIPKRAKSFFEAVGTGSDLATYLLTDLCTPKMDCRTASVTAVLVTEIVKRHDRYCGGPVKLGILWLPENPVNRTPEGNFVVDAFRQYYRPPILLDRAEIDGIVQMALEVEEVTKQKRAEIIREALRRKSEELMKQHYPSQPYPEKGAESPTG